MMTYVSRNAENNSNGSGIQRRKAVQKKDMDTSMASELETLQRMKANSSAHRYDAAGSRDGETPPVQPKANTGLPEPLKTNIENMSGFDMSDTNVHYNSSKPAQLNAHAYAQGTDIHLGPGQEKHLPHESWHVVQQKQGRVKPTMQLKGKVNINDDKGLEKEADVMGGKAAQMKTSPLQQTSSPALQHKMNNETQPVQRTSNEMYVLIVMLIIIAAVHFYEKSWQNKRKGKKEEGLMDEPDEKQISEEEHSDKIHRIKKGINKSKKDSKKHKKPSIETYQEFSKLLKDKKNFKQPTFKESFEAMKKKYKLNYSNKEMRRNLWIEQYDNINKEEKKEEDIREVISSNEFFDSLIKNDKLFLSYNSFFALMKYLERIYDFTKLKAAYPEYDTMLEERWEGYSEERIKNNFSNQKNPDPLNLAGGTNNTNNNDSNTFKYNDPKTWKVNTIKVHKDVSGLIPKSIKENVKKCHQSGNGRKKSKIRPKIDTRMHCHATGGLGGGGGVAFIYKKESDGTITPIIYDYASSRNQDNTYVWDRGNIDYDSNAKYDF